MKVAYIASEIAPFASTGGLSEVGASLPRALATLGLDVIRIMPLYRQVAESGLPLRDTGIRIRVPVGFRALTAEIWTGHEPGPLTYFVRRDEYFDRSQLYNLPERDYEDNFERFVFFQKVAVALLDQLGWKADVVHANDWQTGLVPLYLEHGVNGRWRGRKEKTVFTIHNLAFQGIYPGTDYALSNLPFSCFSIESLEFYGKVNCLKAGITAADHVTTVSRTYAQEIQGEGRGYGLDGVLRAASGKLTGIVNGIDHDEWNPLNDPHIARHFSGGELAGKKGCRDDLARSLGLRLKPDQPLVAMVTRLCEDKGFGLLREVMPRLMDEHPVAVAILGQGAPEFTRDSEAWAARWPGRVAFRNTYDRVLSHRFFAGADLFLMPSRTEPCGLSQMFAMRYGTIPIVHATGGLKDTVLSVTSSTAGNGFVFDAFAGESLLAAVQEAVHLFQDKPAWTRLMARAMAFDSSWSQAAQQYADVYARLLSRS